MNKKLTQYDKEYLKMIKDKLNQNTWSVEFKNNVYTVTSAHNEICDDSILWKKMKNQFLDSLVSGDETYQFHFPLNSDAFSHIYNAKVSPWLVARTVHLLGNQISILKSILKNSKNDLNIETVCECLNQEFSYRTEKNERSLYKNSSHNYNAICMDLSYICLHHEDIKDRLSLAFIEHLKLSDLKPNINIDEMSLISIYNSAFSGANLHVLLDTLNISLENDVVDTSNEVPYAIIKISHKMALLHQFECQHINTIVDVFKRHALPNTFVASNENNETTLMIEQSFPEAKEMMATLFKSLIENKYNVHEDEPQEYSILNTIIEKHILDFHLNSKENTHQHKKLKI